MQSYEQLINQAAKAVSNTYPIDTERCIIRKAMKEEFKKLSDEWRMQDVHTDALTAFTVVSKGGRYYQTRKVFTRAECIERGKLKHKRIQQNKHSALTKKREMMSDTDKLLDFIRSENSKKSYLEKRQVR